MATDDLDEKEAALYELAMFLNSVSVNGGDASSCYHVATSVNAQASLPIPDLDASSTFVTSDGYLTNTRPHRTSIATASGHKSLTQSMGKYKLTNTTAPI